MSSGLSYIGVKGSYWDDLELLEALTVCERYLVVDFLSSYSLFLLIFGLKNW